LSVLDRDAEFLLRNLDREVPKNFLRFPGTTSENLRAENDSLLCLHRRSRKDAERKSQPKKKGSTKKIEFPYLGGYNSMTPTPSRLMIFVP
jgi:hypothetical protein